MISAGKDEVVNQPCVSVDDEVPRVRRVFARAQQKTVTKITSYCLCQILLSGHLQEQHHTHSEHDRHEATIPCHALFYAGIPLVRPIGGIRCLYKVRRSRAYRCMS